MTESRLFLCLAALVIAVREGAILSPQVTIELQKLGIESSEPVPRRRPVSAYVQHVFSQFEEKQDELRMYTDRDPRVQFYDPMSESSDGMVEFDLSRAPVNGQVAKIEIAFTGHMHRLFSVQVSSPFDLSTEVNTSYTEQGHVAEITNLVMNQISQTTLRVFVGVIGTENRVRHLNPILAIFLDLNAAVFHLRQKRLAVNTTNSTVTPELAESHSYCRLQPWTFSFSSVQWYPRFIIQPESYRANRCVGECPPTLIDRGTRFNQLTR
ncbi:uncharacterized protein LOC125667904 [Ostrea edulis]|uniref:uncharacterized protein LOC125667904 n=1 Tax=Ostrea edulis TaxID=37623 RepID=UPI002094DD00|nr:uncharacterized protein LOC125667904 [Ostrea edulis]